VVASSPLVPGNDPTLMFTNSGMVQFKDVFLGSDKRPYVRAASVQACLRAGGKHNDLENVGYTARHHTFFEMLGNWSFGDYFKRDSLKWGWELLTEVYKLPADKLWATVYIDDDEAYDIWTKEIGLPPERVVRIGDNKGAKYASDNFWMMADTGPCGPCSEIFYDHGPEIPGGPPGSPDADGDRYIEIWNHVFMQFDMQPDGSVKKLPAPCVDTGMGLERLAAILQHVHSNYEIDMFDTLIKAAARETGCTDLNNKSLRVIADHIRATAFLVSDGVIPEQRGPRLCAAPHRAPRDPPRLQAGPEEAVLPQAGARSGEADGRGLPEPGRSSRTASRTCCKVEEERFFETLENGMEILDAAGWRVARGAARRRGLQAARHLRLPARPVGRRVPRAWPEVDEAGFHTAMDKQKAQARAAGKFKMDRALEYTGAAIPSLATTRWKRQPRSWRCTLDGAGGAAAHRRAGGRGGAGQHAVLFRSGGQVGDQGAIVGSGPLSTWPTPRRSRPMCSATTAR
jgi:alanyl-tRNA synthetase